MRRRKIYSPWDFKYVLCDYSVMDLIQFIHHPPNMFIKEDLNGSFKFETASFEFFLQMLDLDKGSKNQVRKILKESRRLPAALGPYHGTYEGGLYDHTLLVTNFVYQIRTKPDILIDFRQPLKSENVDMSDNYDDINLEKAVQTAIYHDFGKVPFYGWKLDLEGRTVWVNKQQINVAVDLINKYGYYTKDLHVDWCIAVLDRNRIPYDEEICKAIIFHHGKWSKYEPYEPTRLSELIHVADMIASQIFDI